jgi:hypothetical protein
MGMTLLETVTVGSGGTTSLSITNIPQTGKDLWIIISGRMTSSYVGQNYIRFNSNDYGNNYGEIVLYGGNSNSVGVAYDEVDSDLRTGDLPGSLATANHFGVQTIYIPNYTGSEVALSIQTGSGDQSSTQYQSFTQGYYSNGPVTAFNLGFQGGLAQHTTVSAYITTDDS